MVKMYLFFYAPADINVNTVFWSIKCGHSLRDRKNLDFVTKWFSHSWEAYFHIEDKEVSDYIENIAKSLYPTYPHPTLLIKRGVATIGWMAKTIRQANFADFSVPNVTVSKTDLVWNGILNETDSMPTRICPSAR